MSYTYRGVGVWKRSRFRCCGTIKGHLKRLRCMNFGTYDIDGKRYCSHHRYLGLLKQANRELADQYMREAKAMTPVDTRER